MEELDFNKIMNKISELFNVTEYGILLDVNTICKIENMIMLYNMKNLENKNIDNTVINNIVKLYNTLMI